MKRVATAESLAEIGHYRNILEQEGIACLVKNEQLSGALGEVPFLECLPELWVVREDQLDAAQEVLTALRQPAEAAPPWPCSGCGGSIEGQFAICWYCGQADDRDT
jgi:hypothetical protein